MTTLQKLSAAERIAQGKVHQALSLVSYEPAVAKAMTFVFSDTLICDDAESAKKVTFSDQVHVKSVTLAGDVYDPSGSLTGGSAPSSSGILIRVQELLALERKLFDATRTLEEDEKDAEKAKKKREEWKACTRELEIKEHELKLEEEQVAGSNAAQASLSYVPPVLLLTLLTLCHRLVVKWRSLSKALRTFEKPSKPPRTNKRRLTTSAKGCNATWTSSRITKKAK